MKKGKSRSPPKRSNGRLPLILACLPTTCKNTDSQGCEAFILPFTICGIAGTSQTARIRNHNQKTYQNRKKRGKTIWK
ncbi:MULTISPECIES: hypothetical protein [Clostridia]|uniref:hypothetical protein n=1 Tax=Clostridia TaxID=186801 RepID=UPI001CD109B2|nr:MULTISPECIES: hypothetical protein [Bacillota]MCB7343707.1 hypothetical protein [Blautia obeum]MCI2997481.1 hypothetical protein [[Clostridium] innocuum]MCR0138204.1 hypothetical protein [[Clostridium] innocuum]MCR0423488.1 hypothetical protein [[Clostridium] innocuum]